MKKLAGAWGSSAPFKNRTGSIYTLSG